MISYTENATNRRRYNHLLVKRRLLRLRINIFVGGVCTSVDAPSSGRPDHAVPSGVQPASGRAAVPRAKR